MEDIITCQTPISECCEAEFNQFLALVDKDEHAHYIKLQQEQEEYICNVRRKVAALLTGDVREIAALRPYFASLDRQDVCRELDARAAVVQKRYRTVGRRNEKMHAAEARVSTVACSDCDMGDASVLYLRMVE